MYTARNQYVREVASRILASRLDDEDCLKGLFFAIKAYRDNPRAFGSYRNSDEPISISDAFQWEETDPKLFEFWQKVDSYMADLYNELLAESQLSPDDEFCFEGDDEDEECDCGCDMAEEATDDMTVLLTRGPVIYGWALEDKDSDETLPIFIETRNGARALKDEWETIRRAALVTLAD